MDYHDRIVVNPKIHLGKPCVRGTRIPIEAVLELVAAAIPFDQILRDYHPDLKIEDIKACVEYARQLARGEEIRSADSP